MLHERGRTQTATKNSTTNDKGHFVKLRDFLGFTPAAKYDQYVVMKNALLMKIFGNLFKSKTGANSVASAASQARFMEGLALHQNGNLAHAQELYEEVLNLQPNHFDALHFLGVIAYQAGNSTLAVKLIDKAIAINPSNAVSYSNRGMALQDLRRFEEALLSFNQALLLQPDLAEAYSNRANTLKDLNRLDEALASCEQAIMLRPDYAEAFYNRGIALKELRRMDEALIDYGTAIKLKPGYAEVWCNRGIALAELRRLEEAINSLEHAIALKPGLAEAHLNLALTCLLMGDFSRGWKEYEWRWKSVRAKQSTRYLARPIWLGKESLKDKTILLHSEQGLGDTLQFCRYAQKVSDLGARVILEAPRPLLTLLQTIEGVEQLVASGSALPTFDYHCPLMSLPLAFNTDLSTIPSSKRYITSNSRKVAEWQARLGKKTKFRVGLVWSGGFRPDQPEVWGVNSRRNIKLSALAPLRNEGLEFYSLQKGQPAESELAELKTFAWDGPEIIDFTSQLADFSDTAALIENLDLVISVDTSTAHLVGALGKPVWILNRVDTCWRWLLDREDSPWYQSVRLFRQQKVGDWDSVVEEVRQALQKHQLGRPEGRPVC